MRNILTLIMFVFLCGCRVDMLQLLGATIDSDEARAQRGLPPLALVESEGETEESLLPEEDLTAVRFEFVGEEKPAATEETTVPEETRTEVCAGVGPGESCENYGAACPEGFWGEYGNQNRCHEIDECRYNLHDCTEEQVCVNTVGSFECHPAPSDAAPEPERAE